MMASAPSRAEGSSEISYRLLLSQVIGARAGSKKPLTLFLGAGCSLSSAPADGQTIASTNGIIASLVDEWLCRPESSILSESALWELFHKLWIKQGLEQRRHDVARRLVGLKPSSGYRALARLAAQGCFTAIITTNFDLLLDHSLEDVPHSTQVGSSHFEPAPSNRNALQLVKVHGDVRKGGLLFEPRQLHQLPQSIQLKVLELTSGPTLVVGYRGQDQGIMTSLCRKPDFNAFWSSPRPPTYDEEYHYAPVLDWMQSRHSRSNFLFGDTFGKFDALFERLEEDLRLHGTSGSFIRPTFVSTNFIVAGIRTSPRLADVYAQVREIIADEYQRAPPDAPVPFAAVSVLEARESLLKCLTSDIVLDAIGFVLRNEVEALAFAIAVEISACAGLGTTPACAFVRQSQAAYESRQLSIKLGETIWDFVVSLCDGDEGAISPGELRVHFNSKIQLTLLSDSIESNRLKAALRLAHGLCWLAKSEIAPALLETEFAEILTSLRNKVRDAYREGTNAVVRLDSITSNEVALLESQILGLTRTPASSERPLMFTSGALRIEAESLHRDKEAHSDAANTLFEQVCVSAGASIRAFLAVPDPYGALHRDSVPTSIDLAFKGFAASNHNGLIVVGESGTGKTSAIRRFVKACDITADCNVLIRTPRAVSMAFSVTRLFFPALSDSPSKEQHHAIAALNDSFDRCGKTLYLILDGFNEFNGEFERIINLYRDLIEFNTMLSEANFSRIKTVTTVRPHFFNSLCRACFPPSPKYFYSIRETDRDDEDAAIVRVLPLSADEIKGIARLCFRPNTVSAFLELLSESPRLAKDYSHPVLLTMAGHLITSSHQIESLRRSAVLFQRFADRMLETLGDASQQHQALEIIHAYFEVQIHQSSPVAITEFSLSKGLGRVASEGVRRVTDAGIFRVSPRGTVSFSHDRIAEHFLGHYLFHNLSRPLVIAAVFMGTIANALYFGGLRSLVSRLLSVGAFDGDLRALYKLHEMLNTHVLADGAPTSELLIEALCDFEPNDNALAFIDQAAPDTDAFRRALAHGLWRTAEKHFLCEILEHFSTFCETLSLNSFGHSELLCALAYAMLSDSTNANSSVLAEEYLARVYPHRLMTCSQIWQDRYRMARAKLARQNGQVSLAIEELSDLYRSQLEQAAWTHAASTALELGRAYRDNTQLSEALAVYAEISKHIDGVGDLLTAKLALQTATVEKNLLQDIVRTTRHHPEVILRFNSAMRYLDEARRCSRSAGFMALEVEASVERIELFLAAWTVIDDGSRLAREACLEAERLLSFYPNHHQLVAFRRQLAKLSSLEGRYLDAIDILEQAWQMADNIKAHFYAADCDYQLGHLIAQVPELHDNPELCIKGVAALKRAIAFYDVNCAPDIVYKRHCIDTLASLSGT